MARRFLLRFRQTSALVLLGAAALAAACGDASSRAGPSGGAAGLSAAGAAGDRPTSGSGGDVVDGEGGENTGGVNTGGTSTAGTSAAGVQSGGAGAGGSGGAHAGGAGAGTGGGGRGGESVAGGGEAGAAGETAAIAGAAGEGGGCSPHGCPEPMILDTIEKPFGIVASGAYVYFTTLEASGNVMRVPIAGGPHEPIATGEVNPNDLAVAAGKVFWCVTDGAAGYVISASVTGGGRTQVAAGQYQAVARVSADADYAYYVTAYNDVMKVSLIAGSTPIILSPGPYNSNIQDMVLFGDKLYWANDGVWASDYSHKEPTTATVSDVSTSGVESRETLVPQLDYPLFLIAVDGTHIFWSDDKYIYSTGMTGGLAADVTPLPVGAAGASPIADMVSDGTNLYFADAHKVYRVPVGGGSAEAISHGWQGLARLAVDANNVYFTDKVGGAVVAIAK